MLNFDFLFHMLSLIFFFIHSNLSGLLPVLERVQLTEVLDASERF